MITISQCFDFTDLGPDEIVLGASLSERHRTLLSSYMLHLDRGAIFVRQMIIADLRSFLRLGARKRAADLLVVLRMFLSKHPDALCVGRYRSGLGRASLASNVRYETCQSPTPSRAGAVILPFRCSPASEHKNKNSPSD